MISTLKSGAASFASTVARAGVLPGDTQRVPCRVHFGEIGHIGDPDIGRKQLALVGPGLRKKTVDLPENVPGLIADTFALRAISDDTGEIDVLPCTTALLMRGPTSWRSTLMSLSFSIEFIYAVSLDSDD